MPKVTFTQEDLLARNQLTASWYRLRVKAITVETASDKVSTNWVTDFVVSDGPSMNTPFRHWFNEKGIGMGRLSAFVECFTGCKITPGNEYELSDIVGKEVLGYCLYNPERKWNEVQDFRQVG